LIRSSEAVTTQLKKQAGRGKISMVESLTKSGVLAGYEAHTKIGKKRAEIKVSPDGELIKD
jgi:hypothetical protein